MGMDEFDASAYMPSTAVAERPNAQTEMMISRQAQEVRMAMYVAKQFPRDTYEAFNRIMKSCERPMLAEVAMYEYPRGDQKVTGPSIRLAEDIARNWGNIDFGVMELEQRNGESTAMAYAWDLETNTRQTKVFVVKHERHTKRGVTKLTDPRDIYELVANNGARRVRACILGVIPGDVVDAAVEKCKHTLRTGNKEPLEDRIRTIIAAFDKEYQVSQEMLEKYIGCKASAFSENDLIRLKNVGRALRDGMTTRNEAFDIRAGQTVNSAVEEQFKEAQEAKNAKKGSEKTAEAADKEGESDGDSGTGSEQSSLLDELNKANL